MGCATCSRYLRACVCTWDFVFDVIVQANLIHMMSQIPWDLCVPNTTKQNKRFRAIDGSNLAGVALTNARTWRQTWSSTNSCPTTPVSYRSFKSPKTRTRPVNPGQSEHYARNNSDKKQEHRSAANNSTGSAPTPHMINWHYNDYIILIPWLILVCLSHACVTVCGFAASRWIVHSFQMLGLRARCVATLPHVKHY